jgi:LysM repeat protein
LIIPVRGYKEKYAKAEDVPYEGDKIIRYKIKKGDTLGEIARKFNTTVNDIRKLNNMEENNSIKFGQIIRIKNQQSDKILPG